jgi:hypothetical protein
MKESDLEKEEKRELALKSIDFWIKERNKSLFQINDLKTQIASLNIVLLNTKKKSLYNKNRYINEVKKNLDFLTEDDKKRFIRNNEQENDSED